MKSVSIIRCVIVILLSISVFVISCEKKIMNIDEKLITDKMLESDANEGGFPLTGMQAGILDLENFSDYEMQQTLVADIYGGYLGLPSQFYDNRNTATYAMVDEWIDRIWMVPSRKVLNPWVMMKKKGFDTKYPDLFGIALIFKVFAGHRIADSFGPIPYSLYGTSAEVKFDSEEESYNVFFEELRQAVKALREVVQRNPNAGQIRYAKFDKSKYNGDYAAWIRVANTLRLRLAMRLSYVNPAKAKIEAEDALKDGGVLENENPSFEVNTGSVNPLWIFTNSWDEARLNASIESFLKGYNDPRLEIYALPATDPSLVGEVKGMRTGAAFTNKNYIPFSKINCANNPYVKLMDVSESFFLRAEGALRGWDMGGTAKEFYEEGVKTSFKNQNVPGVETYLQNSTSTPIDYVDPYNSKNNTAPLTSITIRWDESAGFEEKLERIITQKWIAMFPEGQEAWSEFRRTGYPRLWPVVENYSGGDIPNGEFIKRIKYPPAITNASQSAVAEAISKYLGGSDKLSHRLWWDVK